MRRFHIYITLLCLSLCASSHAQFYTLQQCLEEGLMNNYSLLISRNEMQIAKNNATWGNAGFLPTVDVSAGYNTTTNSTNTKSQTEGTTKDRRAFDQTIDVGVDLNWTIFDGFSITTTYKELQILKQQGEINTRIAIEDFIATLTAEYYNYIQQEIRLKNFKNTMSLSKERLRIVEERYHIGNFSRLDYLQAMVDFNADSTQYMKQQELVHTSRINLNELMAIRDIDRPIQVQDSLIDLKHVLDFSELWESTLATNASLLRANQNTDLAQLDYKKVLSRNYPYLRLNAGYGYTSNKYDVSNDIRRRDNWGFRGGLTIGFNIFDGNRKRERKNASLSIRNAQLERQQLKQSLRADLSNLWQAYQNNIQILVMERQNIIAAKENYDAAKDRYLLGDLSGVAMREAQVSLSDAEERILSAEYETKMCEISLLQLSGKITYYLE